MKRITSILLAVVMLVSVFAVLSVAAADEPQWNVVLDEGIVLNLYEGDTKKGSETVAAKEMGVTQTIDGKSISVAEYANGLVSNQAVYNRTAIKLAQAMLNYGAAAKAYWNYADGVITGGAPVTDHSALLDAEIPEAVYEGAEKFLGATLILDGKMRLRFYFEQGAVITNSLDDNEQGAAEITVDTKGTVCYVEEEITPKDIFESFTYYCDGVEVTYSPLNYLYNVATSEAEWATEDLKNLVASIYAYGLAAQSYRDGGLIALDHLQRTDIDTYEYPIDQIEEVKATIPYNSGSDNNVNCYVDFEDTWSLLIDVTDTTFDSLSVELSDGEYLRFAFLAEEPKLDQPVKYANGYCTFKAAWTFDFTVDIPNDAKFLIMTKMDGKTNVTPKSMTFSKNTTVLENLQNATTDIYSYPIDNLVFDHGIINDVSASGSKWFSSFDAHAFCASGDCKIAIIDITGCQYDYVTLLQDAYFVKQLGWTFLTELPQWKQTVSYATGYAVEGRNGFHWGTDNGDNDGNRHSAYNIAIPDDANYLVLYYMESYYSEGDGIDNDWRYYPNSITFSKTPVGPDYFLKDETLDMYSYPMNEVTPAAGSIFYWEEGHIFKEHDTYWAAFIPIDGTVFDYVTLGVKYNYVIWAFLTDMPEFGQSCENLYADGYTDFLYSNKGHSPNNIEIPDNAKYLVYYYQDDPNTLYYPSSLTFTKEPIVDPFFYLNNTVHNEYSYPMDQITPAEGYIDFQDLVAGEKGYYVDSKGHRVAFIPIGGAGFKYLTITSATSWTGYTFIKELPQLGEKVSYCNKWSGMSDCEGTVKNIGIPSDAKYLVVWYDDLSGGNRVPYNPKSIIFHNNKK